MSLSPENPRSPIPNEAQTDLFPELSISEDTPDLVTAENETVPSAAARFTELTSGQNPANYGLDSEEKIAAFNAEHKGKSQAEIVAALIALTRALDEAEAAEEELDWRRKRRDLR